MSLVTPVLKISKKPYALGDVVFTMFSTCLTIVFVVSVFVYSDVDECTSSSPVCDVNAMCQNTHGSFSCTCKIGYYGDGKTCKGLWGVSLHRWSQLLTALRKHKFITLFSDHDYLEK